MCEYACIYIHNTLDNKKACSEKKLYLYKISSKVSPSLDKIL